MPRVTITVPQKPPQPYRFKLDRKVVSLGRASENDIVIDSSSISGKHAEMQRIEGGYELSDVGSTNGIKFNGMRQQVIPLLTGMSVNLGDVTFDFTLTDEELEILGREIRVAESPIIKEQELTIPTQKSVEDLPEAKPARKTAPQPETTSCAGMAGISILFMILATATFYAGLDIRHRKETGESLLKGIANKTEVQKPDEAAEKAEEKAADDLKKK